MSDTVTLTIVFGREYAIKLHFCFPSHSSLHYLGKLEPWNLHRFTKTLHIALQSNTKTHSIYHLAITEPPFIITGIC